MSGASVALRGATEGAQAAARAERKGWLASLKDEAVSFVKGDNNSPWAILTETVIGCVPVLGQIVDARDIIKGLVEVAAAPASPLAWFNLITALIGLIPGERQRAVGPALWPCVPRGRGIDAVWKTTGARKPYAVIEAKASYDPTKSLRALLGEAGDKTDSSGGTAASSRRSGRTGNKGGSPGAGAIRQTNGKVTQMSHSWVLARLRKAVGAASKDWPELRDHGKRVYSRHVMFFAIPQAVAHAEALILHASGRPVEHSAHAAHQITREWGDNQIDQVVNDRADIPAASRRR